MKVLQCMGTRWSLAGCVLQQVLKEVTAGRVSKRLFLMLSFEPTVGKTVASSWLAKSHTVKKRQEEYIAVTVLRCVYI